MNNPKIRQEAIKGRGINFFLPAFILTLFFFQGKAQVTVQLQPVLPTGLHVADMWKATIINAGSSEVQVYLKGSVSNAGSVQIVEGMTEMLLLKPGPNLVSPTSVAVKGYNYNTSVNIPNLASTETFPYGSYSVCLKVYGSGNNELAVSCLEADVKPMSPPMLLSPYNQAEIHTSYPLLLWSAPTPATPGLNVSYDLKVVEVLSGQNPADAIQRNFALVDEKNSSTNFFQYPVNAVKLESGKNYAWQIVCKGDDFLIGSTEVWSFTLARDSTNISVLYLPDQYYRLKPQLDGGYGIAIETLGITWDEEQAGELTIRVFDEAHNEIKVKELKAEKIAGNNRFVINLKETGKFKNNRFYIIEVTGVKKSGVILFKYYSSRKKYEEVNTNK